MILEPTDPPVPDWVRYFLDDSVFLQTAFWLIALIVLLIAIMKLGPVLNKFVMIVNAAAGLPVFIAQMNEQRDVDDARRREDDARHAALAKQVGEIHHEVHYNNGTSVKDAVRRVEEKVTLLVAEDALIREELGITGEKRRRQNGTE